MTTNTTPERNELAGILWDSRGPWITNADRVQMMTKQADAILAAGYRKPRTITTVEELDALPETSVVLDAGGDVSRRVLSGWTTTVLEADGGMWLTDNMETAELPATVLYTPEPTK